MYIVLRRSLKTVKSFFLHLIHQTILHLTEIDDPDTELENEPGSR